LPRQFSQGAAHSQSRHDLLKILRSLALKNQREQPRVFYSLREVAKKFKVPVSTVAKTYYDMEQEGLLSRVRGSKTILNGLRYNRRRVRGVIGLPALLSNFVAIPDYRTFFVCLQRELWLRDFAATMVFFRPEEAVDGTISDRLRDYQVDTVIWLQPGRTAKESLLRLSDVGIRLIVISQIGTPIAPSRYYVWKERAVETLLRQWRDRNSVRGITIVDSKDYRSPVTEEILRLVLDNVGLDVVIRTFRDEPSHAFLHDLCRTKTHGIIFPSAGLASMFSFQSPEKLTALLRVQRVALIDGPIDMPFVKVPDVPVDLVIFDWQAIAESIVNDLITQEAFDRNRRTTFEAEVEFGVPLSNFSEPIHPLRSTGSV
jgi:hypothetical protein